MEIRIICFPLFALWGLALFLILFRRGLELIWKLASVLLFCFYAMWFRSEIAASWALYRDNFSGTFPVFLAVLGNITSLALLLMWPVALLIAFFARSPDFSRGVTRALVLLTVFIWLFWLLDFFTPPFMKDALEFLGEKIGQLLKTLASPPAE